MFYKGIQTLIFIPHTRPKTTTKENDLKFLLVASQSLSEEIKVQQCYSEQGKLIISREKGIEKLLNTFFNIVKNNNDLQKYTKPITALLTEAKMKVDTFASIDISHFLTNLKRLLQLRFYLCFHSLLE